MAYSSGPMMGAQMQPVQYMQQQPMMMEQPIQYMQQPMMMEQPVQYMVRARPGTLKPISVIWVFSGGHGRVRGAGGAGGGQWRRCSVLKRAPLDPTCAGVAARGKCSQDPLSAIGGLARAGSQNRGPWVRACGFS